jgi:hypothetical protein
MALVKQVIDIPFAGIDTKSDPKVFQPPGLTLCTNAEFQETGGLTKRYPYTALSSSTLAGGSISNIRRVVSYGDELLAFTKDTLYSWSSGQSKWVSRSTYLAPKITQTPLFDRNSEQYLCDRATLSNVTFYSWNDRVSGEGVYVGAVDSTTGAVLLSPTSMGVDTGVARLVVLTNRVLLFAQDKANGDLLVKALDPSNISTSVATAFTTVTNTEYETYFDVAALSSTTAVVVWRRTTTTSYGYATVTEGPVVTASTKARACTGPIAVAVSSSQSRVAVIRESAAGTLTADILTTAMADSTVGVAFGTITTGAARIGACFDTTNNRCYAFWDNGATQPSCETKYNYISSTGTAGTEAAFVYNTQIISTFVHDGLAYVWVLGAPSSTLQRSYFLYRYDGLLVAKAVTSTAGPTANGYVTSTQSLGSDTYAFCGAQSLAVRDASTPYYGNSSPVDIRVTFDSNEARRCVQLGKTLFVSGGQILQYDGEGLTELGFHTFPQYLLSADTAAGNLAAGSYNWKQTDAWFNAKGERDRGTTTTVTTTTMGASRLAQFSIEPTTITLKKSPRGSIVKEVWRTQVAAAVGADYYLVTSKDPVQAATVNNGYLENSPTTLGYQSTTKRDNYADATLITKETNPENGDILERIAPYPATIIIANHERLFLAGIAGDPYAVWPSLVRNEDEVPGFNEASIIRLPALGGDIKALGFLDNTLIVFKETAIYSLPGSGVNNAGEGQNFGPPELIASDIGCTSADLIIRIPTGLMFFSNRGWQLLDRGRSIHYIGAPIEEYNSDTWHSVVVMESKHQVRCGSNSRFAVYDWDASERVGSPCWSTWTIEGRHQAVWDDTHYIYSFDDDNIKYQRTAHSAQSGNYSLIAETAWLKLAGLQGFQRIWRVGALSTCGTRHTLGFTLYKDYAASSFDSSTFTATVPDHVTITPATQQVKAIKIKVTLTGDLESCTLSGLSLELGMKKGSYRLLPAAQKS